MKYRCGGTHFGLAFDISTTLPLTFDDVLNDLANNQGVDDIVMWEHLADRLRGSLFTFHHALFSSLLFVKLHPCSHAIVFVKTK